MAAHAYSDERVNAGVRPERHEADYASGSLPEWLAQRRLHPLFEERLRRLDWKGVRVLDVGTGKGRAALLLAELGAVVIGIDWDGAALAEARRLASERGVRAAWFLEADAESLDYRLAFPGLRAVTAHLCVSEEIVRRAGTALARSGRLLLCAIHADTGKEIGQGSRFAFTEQSLEEILRAAGFDLEWMAVDTFTVSYASLQEFAATRSEAVERWKREGGWESIAQRFEEGGGRLTTASLVVDAVKA